jgi:hypothetical protein
VPFLRFSKDRRGYESTFLLHAHRAGERDAPVLLYWFRSPPHVKMGRAALDEETVRVLEDTHPAVDFDWPRILATRPQPSEPPPDSIRLPRARRRGETRGEERGGSRPSRQAPPVREVPPPMPSGSRLADEPSEAVVTEAVPAAEPVNVAAPEANVFEVVEPQAPVRRFTRIFDAPAASSPEPGQPIESPVEVGRLSEVSASERALGSEQLERLRGRYAAFMARISRRITDPALVERLRGIAERANPDGWVTDDEVKAGVAGSNAVYTELVSHVGRRRRRRRSGRRAAADSGAPITGDALHAGPAMADGSVDPDNDGRDDEEPDDEKSSESGE